MAGDDFASMSNIGGCARRATASTVSVVFFAAAFMGDRQAFETRQRVWDRRVLNPHKPEAALVKVRFVRGPKRGLASRLPSALL